ncbi:hypothetical protein HC256_010033 [Beauveria bassiana]|nr:hypothetical protein HC256_010033 [Beauveria bassiana]
MQMKKAFLCFEMEAAGTVAYARGLIYKISPKKVEVERKLIELVENSIVPQTYTELWIYDVNAHSEPQSPGYAVSEAIRTTSEVITDIESTVAKDGDDKILNWPTPTPIDYGSQYSDLLKVRQPGTGQWFLDSTQYQTWRTTQKQNLFSLSIPGSGKTIFISIVIDDLFYRFASVNDVGVAFI